MASKKEIYLDMENKLESLIAQCTPDNYVESIYENSNVSEKKIV